MRNLFGRRRAAGFLAVWLLVLSAPMLGVNAAPAPQAAGVFSMPLGAHDGVAYGIHVLQDANGNLIEDTGYGVQNPDLQGATCFGQPWDKLYHTGWDLYRADGQSAAGAEVTAAADGVVVYANPSLNYPGAAVIIEHTLASGEKLYTVYAHLDDNSVAVNVGQSVTRGERLGTVLHQYYTGRYPQQHPSGDDSHLHFEIRRFFSAREIYPAYPACDGLIVGRGYTYPERPDDFPAPGAGYIDPGTYIH